MVDPESALYKQALAEEAAVLGIALPQERYLMPIAEEALLAEPPSPWKVSFFLGGGVLVLCIFSLLYNRIPALTHHLPFDSDAMFIHNCRNSSTRTAGALTISTL
jgi:hypothetical protein